jgi:heat shock protein HslJ
MSRHRWWIILGLLGVLLLAAVGDAPAFGGLPLPCTLDKTTLDKTTWTLQSSCNAGADIPLPTGTSIFVVFHRLGHDFSGDDGCKSLFGKFSSLWPGRLSFSIVGQTLVGCSRNLNAFEARYLAGLLAVETFRTSSIGLVLAGDNGRVELRFSAYSV